MEELGCILNQLLIRQALRRNQLGKRVPENELVFTIVKPMLQLIQIGVQMLRADLVIRTDDGAFKQAFVRVDRFRVGMGVLSDELVQRVLRGVFDNLQANFASTLHRTNGDCFVATIPAPMTANLSADIGFVHFHNAPQKLAVGITHRGADAMAQMPSGLVSDVQRPLDLQCGDSLFAFGHQVDRQKPFLQRQVAIVEDRASGNGKVILATVAMKLFPFRYFGNLFAITARAINAIRPARKLKTLPAFFIRAELLNELHQVHFVFNNWLRGFFRIHVKGMLEPLAPNWEPRMAVVCGITPIRARSASANGMLITTAGLTFWVMPKSTCHTSPRLGTRGALLLVERTERGSRQGGEVVVGEVV